jgi:hypothetical protein
LPNLLQPAKRRGQTDSKGYLKEFVEQPFIKTKNVTPELLGKTQHSKANDLYWINTNSLKPTAIQPEPKQLECPPQPWRLVW